MADGSAGASDELKTLLRLAVPTVLGMLGHQLNVVVTTWMVTPLGSEAMAGASLAGLWSFGVLILARGCMRGLDPLVAQSFGAEDYKAVSLWLVRGLILGFLIGIPTAGLHLVAEPVLRWFQQPEEALPLAGAWCRILAWSILPLMLWGSLSQFLTSIGIVRPQTIGIVFGNLITISCNLLFIYVLGWGALGCAWSTVLADLGMAGMVLWLVREELRRWWPSQLKDFKSEVQALKKLLVLGVPVGFQQGLEVWGFSIAGLMMGWLGKEVLAAHSLCLNLSSISFMFPFGIGLAACTQVGQLLGAGRDWGRAAGIALGCGAGSMLCFSALFGLFPELPLGIYRPKPEVLAIALGLLPVASAFQLFDGIQGVAFGILRGVGDVRLPALINVIGYYLVGLPLGYYLTFKTDFGARGIWVGLTMALATVAGLLLLRLYRVYRLGGFRV